MPRTVERYAVRHAYVPDEVLWCNAEELAELRQKVAAAWPSFQRIAFRYSVLTTHEHNDLDVVIDDNEDFHIWLCGEGSIEQPRPFTQVLYAFDLARSPAVLNVADPYRAAMSSATIHAQQLKALGATVVVRHSNAQSVFLLDRPGVTTTGGGAGGWGAAVRKARNLWNVERPVFRYSDIGPGGTDRVFVSVYDVNDYVTWCKYRQSLNAELTVFDGADPAEVEPRSFTNRSVTPAHILATVVPPMAPFVPNKTLSQTAAGVSSSVVPKVRLVSRPTDDTLRKAIERGEFGPYFTTAANSTGSTHFNQLVQRFSKPL